MNTRKPELRLNTITGPKVTAPAVSPETLRELNHPCYNFLHTYCIESRSNRWHGRLKNIGFQLPINDTVVLPPVVAEMLKLYNDDIAKIYPSNLSEASIILYETLNADETDPDSLSHLQNGVELTEKSLEFNRSGVPIRILSWEPANCYVGPNTEIVDVKNTDVSSSGNHYADDVITDEPSDNKQIEENNTKLLK